MANVSVACKLPHGLVLSIEGKPSVTLAGANHPDAVAGFGITRVDKDFFEAWSGIHKDFIPLTKGLIFAQERSDSLRAEANEKTSEKTGFEGLNPQNPGPGLVPAAA